MKDYLVIYERGPRNWSAYVPDLPACTTAGDSREECETLIKEAISLYLEELEEEGWPAPDPSTFADRVQVA